MPKWVYTLPLLALAWGHQAKAADIDAGKAKSVVCAACHGADGKASVSTYPHLAGQNQAYLLKQMKAFKEGSRTEPLMVPFMAMLTEADINKALAATDNLTLKPEGKATEELRNSLRIGTLLGVQGTPATLIGNQLVPGAIPYDELEQLVKAELAKRS